MQAIRALEAKGLDFVKPYSLSSLKVIPSWSPNK